jgi:hypothetical protein
MVGHIIDDIDRGMGEQGQHQAQQASGQCCRNAVQPLPAMPASHRPA